MTDRETWRVKFHVGGRCALISKGELSKQDAIRTARLSVRGLIDQHSLEVITADIQVETAPGRWETKRRMGLYKPQKQHAPQKPKKKGWRR